MLKFLHVAWIFNFRTFLADFNLDFKHILFRLDELLGLPYMVGKLGMFSFQLNLNSNNIPLVAPIYPKQYTKFYFGKFDKIRLVISTLWNNMFPNSIWPENLSQYSFMCPVFPCKISAWSDGLRDMFNLVKLVSKHFKVKFRPDLIHITNLVNS
jgi:hypothetical protein